MSGDEMSVILHLMPLHPMVPVLPSNPVGFVTGMINPCFYLSSWMTLPTYLDRYLDADEQTGQKGDTKTGKEKEK